MSPSSSSITFKPTCPSLPYTHPFTPQISCSVHYIHSTSLPSIPHRNKLNLGSPLIASCPDNNHLSLIEPTQKKLDGRITNILPFPHVATPIFHSESEFSSPNHSLTFTCGQLKILDIITDDGSAARSGGRVGSVLLNIEGCFITDSTPTTTTNIKSDSIEESIYILFPPPHVRTHKLSECIDLTFSLQNSTSILSLSSYNPMSFNSYPVPTAKPSNVILGSTPITMPSSSLQLRHSAMLPSLSISPVVTSSTLMINGNETVLSLIVLLTLIVITSAWNWNWKQKWCIKSSSLPPSSTDIHAYPSSPTFTFKSKKQREGNKIKIQPYIAEQPEAQDNTTPPATPTPTPTLQEAPPALMKRKPHINPTPTLSRNRNFKSQSPPSPPSISPPSLLNISSSSSLVSSSSSLSESNESMMAVLESTPPPKPTITPAQSSHQSTTLDDSSQSQSLSLSQQVELTQDNMTFIKTACESETYDFETFHKVGRMLFPLSDSLSDGLSVDDGGGVGEDDGEDEGIGRFDRFGETLLCQGLDVAQGLGDGDVGDGDGVDKNGKDEFPQEGGQDHDLSQDEGRDSVEEEDYKFMNEGKEGSGDSCGDDDHNEEDEDNDAEGKGCNESSNGDDGNEEKTSNDDGDDGDDVKESNSHKNEDDGSGSDDSIIKLNNENDEYYTNTESAQHHDNDSVTNGIITLPLRSNILIIVPIAITDEKDVEDEDDFLADYWD